MFSFFLLLFISYLSKVTLLSHSNQYMFIIIWLVVAE